MRVSTGFWRKEGSKQGNRTFKGPEVCVHFRVRGPGWLEPRVGAEGRDGTGMCRALWVNETGLSLSETKVAGRFSAQEGHELIDVLFIRIPFKIYFY